ncbi:DnaJ-class molecular chaperone with C-terminal Zn finger domain [Synechococcus sp. PCC 7502]|uniref:J domain-containing protein n=1 Tax=Synechococcus sp. PCC 7502 TaxID=1173263 RepID=UPI00029FD34B|nr:J domain-containing protein [Synechococcus sp. PCC 7502]AFY74120.1 DnaJ-class molecular chaperone with C-terminal Zn finger domain [Synechococcus sp. PCC 7502]
MARKPKASTRNAVAPPDNSSNELDLSELRVRLNFLEKENAKLLQQIEKKRTELNKLTDGINELGIKIRQHTIPIMQQLLELNGQIHAVFTEIFTGRKLGKQSRQNIESVYYSLQASGLISPKREPNHKNMFEFNFDFPEGEPDEEYKQQRSQREIKQDAEKLDREELKKIRQTYLRLAEIFHPDKLTDAEDKEYYTEVMKEVNQAYQTGDLAKLLAIEKQQELGQIINRNSTDELSRQCAKVEAENAFLKSQFENLKRELRTTKNTNEGGMASEYKKITKLGIDPIAEAVEGMEAQVKMTEEIYKFVTDFRDRRITIKEFLKGPATLTLHHQISDEELLEMLFS